MIRKSFLFLFIVGLLLWPVVSFSQGLSPFELQEYLKNHPEIMQKYGASPMTPLVDAQPGLKPQLKVLPLVPSKEEKEVTPAAEIAAKEKMPPPPEELPVFGHQLFSAGPTSFTPLPNIPVTSDYTVGPDDNIIIHLWGGLNATYYLTVKRDGTIQIPVAGTVIVAGLTFRETEGLIRKKFETTPGVNVSVTMGPLRSITVFIVGAAKQPGAYTVSSFDTILSALIYAGGPEVKSAKEAWYKEKLRKDDFVTKQLKEKLKPEDTKPAGGKDKYSTVKQLIGILKEQKQSEDMIKRLKDLDAVQLERELTNLEIIEGKKEKYLSVKQSIEKLKTDKELTQETRKLEGLNVRQLEEELRKVERIEAEQEKDYTLKQYVYPESQYRDIKERELLLTTLLGSMRKIQLKRQNMVLSTFDLYDLILKGDSSKDLRLQQGDIIFVPKPEAVVAVYGDVKVPALYELKKEEGTLLKTLELAGGLKPSAFSGRIQVQRYFDNKERVVLDISLEELKRTQDSFHLQDGDFVAVLEVMKEDVNAVYLFGNVKRPGKYQYKMGMRLRDILKDVRDLKPETYFPYAVIKRHQLPERKATLLSVKLGDALIKDEGAANLALQPYDEIYVFSEWDFKSRPVITISGEVRNPGTYLYEKNMLVKDAIYRAGGLTPDAHAGPMHIFRTHPETKEISMLIIDLAAAQEGHKREEFTLQDKDRLVIHSIKEYKPEKKVSIDGEVQKPGAYPLAEGMTVRDLVFASGNLKESAYLFSAELSRFDISDGKLSKIELRDFNLKKALEGDTVNNLRLAAYDRVFIKRITDWREEKFVNVSGEFKFPGRYIIKKGEKLSSLMSRAGWFTDDAYLRGAVFTRERVRDLQQKSLEEMTLRLERELLAEGAAQISASLSEGEVKAKEIELVQKQKFIESLRKVKATGRMTIKLASLKLVRGGEYDIELEDGDSLFIPQKNNVVNVVGAVMAPASYIYLSKFGYEDYINMTGGYAKYADKGNVFVLKVDGSARKVSSGFISWSSTRSRWEEEADIEPGDVIVVPEKIDRIAWLREIRDITQILMQMAVVAGVTVNLF